MFNKLIEELAAQEPAAAERLRQLGFKNVEMLAWAFSRYAWPERRTEQIAKVIADHDISTAAGFSRLRQGILKLDSLLVKEETVGGARLHEARLIREGLDADMHLRPNSGPTEQQAYALVSAAFDLIDLCPGVYRKHLRDFQTLAGNYGGSDLLADDQWRPEFAKTLLGVHAGADLLLKAKVDSEECRKIFRCVRVRNFDAEPERWQLLVSLVDRINEKVPAACAAFRDDRLHVLALWSVALCWCIGSSATALNLDTNYADLLLHIRRDADDYKPLSSSRITSALKDVRALLPSNEDMKHVRTATNLWLDASARYRGLAALALTSTAAAVLHGDFEPPTDRHYRAAMQARLTRWIQFGNLGQSEADWRQTSLSQFLDRWVESGEGPGIHVGRTSHLIGSILGSGPASRKLGPTWEAACDEVLAHLVAGHCLSDKAKRLARALTTIVIAPTRANAAQKSQTTLSRFSDGPNIASLKVALKVLMDQGPQHAAAQVIAPIANRKQINPNDANSWQLVHQNELPSSFYAKQQ